MKNISITLSKIQCDGIINIRKKSRKTEFCYNIPTAYFVTICTEQKQPILSNIVGGDVLDAPQSDDVNVAKVELLECGKIAEKYILQLNDFYEDITVEKYVIMPDHIHMLLRVLDAEVGGASRTSPPTKQHSRVMSFVSTFKRFFNKEFGRNIWQRSFYDHVIRDAKDYEEPINYIVKNPMRWYYKHPKTQE